MIRNTLATRIWLEVVKRAKYSIFLNSGRRVAAQLARRLSGGPDTVVAIVGFNDHHLIGVQLELLNKYSKHQVVCLVADNSEHSLAASRIERVTREFGAEYVRLPYNLYTKSRGAAKPGRGSLSHSVALDWLWNRVFQKAAPKYVVLVDHDVFPLKPFDVGEILDGVIAAGPPRYGAGRWTIWPGLAFFRFRDVSRFRITFLPSGDLDSGAGLWKTLLSKVETHQVRLMNRNHLEIIEGAHPAKKDVEIIDDAWLHLGDGSGWFDGVSKVDELILR